MIKINLLPKIVNEKRAVRLTAMALAVLLAAVLAIGLSYSMKLRGDVAAMEQQASIAEENQRRVEAIQKQASDLKSSITPIKEKLDFINDVLDYNTKFPALYEQVAKWTYDKVCYDTMQSDGTIVQMTARVKSLDDLGRYLLNMYKASDLFTSVDISGVPGYGVAASNGPGGAPGGFAGGAPAYQGGQIGTSMSNLAGINAIDTSVGRSSSGQDWIPFTVVCKLKTPIVAPSFKGGGGATGAGGPEVPAAPMGAPGMPGPGGPAGMPRSPMMPGGAPRA